MLKTIFQYEEPSFYTFGLQLGMANLWRNGFRLGIRKTLGKILQPINSYTRFPEYRFMEAEIRTFLNGLPKSGRPKILDVGSPKSFGLYLAYEVEAEIQLTDVFQRDLEEAELLWNVVRGRAKGAAAFAIEDARKLSYPAETFDVVYSMSVIEHVEGEAGDTQSAQEMMRVLKPGGLLLISVPCGQHYVEQSRADSAKNSSGTWHADRSFFQRVYTPAAAEERILGAVRQAKLRGSRTISRKPGLLGDVYRRFGVGIRGLLGFCNPLLSAILNESHEGLISVEGEYGDRHSVSDTYGDFMLAWEKTPETSASDTSSSPPARVFAAAHRGVQ